MVPSQPVLPSYSPYQHHPHHPQHQLPQHHHHHPQHHNAHAQHPGAHLSVQHTDDAASKETQYLRRRCFNCHTTEPPSWRRSTLNPGKIVCNKCGLYERTHLRPRPLRFDELRSGGKPRKAASSSPSGAAASGQLPKKAKLTNGLAARPLVRRSSVSSNSSVHSSSDWDDSSQWSSSLSLLSLCLNSFLLQSQSTRQEAALSLLPRRPLLQQHPHQTAPPNSLSPSPSKSTSSPFQTQLPQAQTSPQR